MPMEGGATPGGRNPRTTEAILDDYANRREGLLTALTQDVEKLYGECNPERENLCLYGMPDGGWAVDLPAEEVPPELPEPTLGINFARDGMARKDWLALVAVHSDAWLIAVAFYYGAKLEPKAKMRLFRGINEYPTLYELITGQYRQNGTGAKRQRVENFQSNREAQASEAPLPTGRLLTYNDITPALKGRQAELYWPDDRMWYLVEIHSVSARQRQAKIQYTSGEFEDLDLEEIIREGHMSLITQ